MAKKGSQKLKVMKQDSSLPYFFNKLLGLVIVRHKLESGNRIFRIYMTVSCYVKKGLGEC